MHPGAVAAARRVGLDLTDATPRTLSEVSRFAGLVVTVCEQAHEELVPADSWLHWSIAGPVVEGTRAAFDATVAELQVRIGALVQNVELAS